MRTWWSANTRTRCRSTARCRCSSARGIKLDRSTLANWVGRACWWLTPLYELMVSTVLTSAKVFADDTTLPVLDPGRGRTKTGRLWCYAVDDRAWDGPGHPAAAYVYSEDRKSERPAGHLAGFRGVLQVDGYAGFQTAGGDRADGSITLAFCWAHMRRPFYEFFTSTKSPLAAEVLARIRELYAIEAEDTRPPRRIPQNDPAGSKSTDRGCAARLVAGSGRSRVRRVRPGPRRSATRSAIGPAWWCSSMTAGSRWTRTSSSVPSARAH